MFFVSLRYELNVIAHSGGGNMRLQSFFLSSVFFASIMQATPIVQNICNDTDIGYIIFLHSDQSVCSLHKREKVVESKGKLEQDFLITKARPSLVLRPAYFYDQSADQRYSFLDDEQKIDQSKLQEAFEVWKKKTKNKKYLTAQDWLNQWIGGDIQVEPYTLEVFGYLINLSRVIISNQISDYATWMSFSKGVFSRLILEINICQHRRKGIRPTLKVIAGEGGICRDGNVERIF